MMNLADKLSLDETGRIELNWGTKVMEMTIEATVKAIKTQAG